MATPLKAAQCRYKTRALCAIFLASSIMPAFCSSRQAFRRCTQVFWRRCGLPSGLKVSRCRYAQEELLLTCTSDQIGSAGLASAPSRVAPVAGCTLARSTRYCKKPCQWKHVCLSMRATHSRPGTCLIVSILLVQQRLMSRACAGAYKWKWLLLIVLFALTGVYTVHHLLQADLNTVTTGIPAPMPSTPEADLSPSALVDPEVSDPRLPRVQAPASEGVALSCCSSQADVTCNGSLHLSNI